ncbi:pentraxin-4 [Ochotona princeps]|uniref:pentraxin-4 n=1 Tax=Ochotona princeps TaxID=9978 RepID=UPI00271537B5|nr:pentraxin-4 [Ochotona princeps]
MMSYLGSRALPLLFLIYVPLCLSGAAPPGASPAGPRKPFFERLRRLEEQFRRLQEVTLRHLQAIADNYSASLSAQARLQATATAMNQSQAAVQGDLTRLKTQMGKSQHRGRMVARRLHALELALSQKGPQRMQAEEDAISGLGLRALQDALARLTQNVHSQDTRLAALEGRLPTAKPSPMALGQSPTRALAPPALADPSLLKRQRGRQGLQASSGARNPAQDFRAQGRPGPGSHQVLSEAALKDPAKWAPSLQEPGEVCDVGPMLVFPNASTENVVFLRPGFPVPLRALSFCSWLCTAAGRLGTLLSYATHDNDNKLVLHGRDSLVPGTIHLVIGDPAFRELPLQPLLDGQWHHVCVIWTSIQGRYWLRVDRRLVATGSHFREGYEIPPGGALVLGQEQDRVGGGFDSSEAFVGSMAGMAIWDRVLTPGEVTSLALGNKPVGAILTLANATSPGRFVQKARCVCPESCP